MICIHADSHLSTFTFIFYTCIGIPLIRTTQSFLRILAFLLNPHHQLSPHTPSCNLDLPVSRFCDLQCSNGKRGDATHDGDDDDDGEEDEMCSICLVEFEKQDSVNKLGRCGHTFHVECMEKWLDTCRFTCPLCRSFLLQPSSSCNTRPHSAPCILPPAHHS